MRAFAVLGLVFIHTKPRDWLLGHLQNDLFCVEWGVRPQLNQSMVLAKMVTLGDTTNTGPFASESLALYFCPQLCQMLTDFDNSLIVRLGSKFVKVAVCDLKCKACCISFWNIWHLFWLTAANCPVIITALYNYSNILHAVLHPISHFISSNLSGRVPGGQRDYIYVSVDMKTVTCHQELAVLQCMFFVLCTRSCTVVSAVQKTWLLGTKLTTGL